jgi:hypothetical protein
MTEAYSPRVDIGLGAAALAMKAKCGQLTRHDVDELRERAEQLLHRDDPMFRDICWFATQFGEHPEDAAHVAYLGRLLHERLVLREDDARADACQRRADING